MFRIIDMFHIPAVDEPAICEAIACPLIVGLASVAGMVMLLMGRRVIIAVPIAVKVTVIPGMSAMLIAAMSSQECPTLLLQQMPDLGDQTVARAIISANFSSCIVSSLCKVNISATGVFPQIPAIF